MYDKDFENNPEILKKPGEREVPPDQDFAKAFENEEDIPSFAGEDFKFGTANENNEYYGESADNNTEAENPGEGNTENNKGIKDAAAIINYGLDAVAREKGVEYVVQGIKNFDVASSEHPLTDLYRSLGVDTKEEYQDVRDESIATKPIKEQFREDYNMPNTRNSSKEGFVKAIADMKELISEIEGADPRYEDLRNSAKRAGEGYFEHAVKQYNVRGLTDLFSALTEQKEHSADTKQEENQNDENNKNDENSENSEKNEENLDNKNSEAEKPEELTEEEEKIVEIFGNEEQINKAT